MFLILCGDPKQVPQGSLLFEVYYDLLWNAAYQHDLNNAAGKALISHQIDPFDEYEHDPREDTPLDPYEDESSLYSGFQSSFNSPESQYPLRI